MPTSYTSEIEKGQSFKEYALRCARAFGALMHMRDEPLDAAIRHPQPPLFHTEALLACRADIEKALAMSDEEVVAVIEKAQKDHEIKRKANSILRDQYKEMISRVREWNPPGEYYELQKFMVDQLEMSLKSDCFDAKLEINTDPKLFRCDLIQNAAKSMRYHIENAQKEAEAYHRAIVWLDGLFLAIDEAPRVWINPDVPLDSHARIG